MSVIVSPQDVKRYWQAGADAQQKAADNAYTTFRGDEAQPFDLDTLAQKGLTALV